MYGTVGVGPFTCSPSPNQHTAALPPQQGAGGGLISGTDPKSRDMGRNLLLAGLFMQLGFFTCFSWLTAWVQTSKDFALRDRTAAAGLVPRLGTVFACLYTTIVLMYLRNIFRTVEFIMVRGPGVRGPGVRGFIWVVCMEGGACADVRLWGSM